MVMKENGQCFILFFMLNWVLFEKLYPEFFLLLDRKLC